MKLVNKTNIKDEPFSYIFVDECDKATKQITEIMGGNVNNQNDINEIFAQMLFNIDKKCSEKIDTINKIDRNKIDFNNPEVIHDKYSNANSMSGFLYDMYISKLRSLNFNLEECKKTVTKVTKAVNNTPYFD